ncbi:uncharacterized protein LOC110984325 isoform X2 [Acanthaster planci]|uniref:Uncharacterized protein LOC110984325 isoform X2 n=1 Tax=Acanthaster planci TaxID=133434 RepID=A0A8B7Z5J8_ACAPL|nr:uncharacterized protein LOC110984325 isoform X2 [Acanthaster planci]
MEHLYLMIMACLVPTAYLSWGLPIHEVTEGNEAVLKCGEADLGNPCKTTEKGLEWSASNSLVASCKHTFSKYQVRVDTQTGALVIPNVSLALNGTTFTCTLLGREQPGFNVTLLVQTKNTGETQSISVAAVLAGTASFVLGLVIFGIGLWKYRRYRTSSAANQAMVLNRQNDANSTTTSLSPILNTTVGSSGSRALWTSRNSGYRHMSSTIGQPPNVTEESPVYAELHNTTAHPAKAPPIRNQPPAQLVGRDQYQLPSSAEGMVIFPDDSDSNNVPKEGFGGEDAPPRPRRGTPIPHPKREWQRHTNQPSNA